MMKAKLLIFSCIIVFLLSEFTYTQTHNDSIWSTLYNDNNVIISFIFYSKADNYNNGIVLKMENLNNHKINYDFKLIFRADTSEVIRNLTGSLNEKEKKAGSSDGLFFIPFKDHTSLSEVGIKGCKITHQNTHR